MTCVDQPFGHHSRIASAGHRDNAVSRAIDQHQLTCADDRMRLGNGIAGQVIHGHQNRMARLQEIDTCGKPTRKVRIEHSWIGLQDDWQIVSESPNFIHAVVTTPVMNFKDDVQLLFMPRDKLIQVRSSSRVGISDLGANARRIGVLRDQLRP